ncbi:alcohol dehydrogenase catalytic domain-containing protein, partial [Arcanobacterium phocae]|uniref:alcohol dehydrogenase catalytic domain-containing protein n=1 Tax=Arcanobacterium phocae TaxID=131112 RepID=UPI0020A1F8D9
MAHSYKIAWTSCAFGDCKSKKKGSIFLITIRSSTMSQPTMTAALVEATNGPFVRRELARPEPAFGQVLVQIAASGTNPLDTKIRAGEAAHARHPLPAILGMDLAGTVVALGEG